MKFSKLEADEKTFIHIEMYYTAIINKTPLMSIGNILQKRELEEHLKKMNVVNGEKQEETLKWIENNCKNLRIYINSLIDFAEFLYMDSQLNYRGDKLIKKLVFDAIKVWNDSVPILEQIRIEDKI
jgi:hypothetical protein